MDTLLHLFKDPVNLIHYGGIFLLLIIIYLETGFFLGLVLPGGDYLVFTAGILCGTHYLEMDLSVLLISMIIAAALGDLTGYLKGRWLGPKLFEKPDNRIFKREYLVKTKKYYEKYGAWAFVLGRFLPVVRTLVPILAGASGLSLKKFSYSAPLGAIAWIGVLTPLGFYLGAKYPRLLDYSIYFLAGFILLASIPMLKIINPFGKKKKKPVKQNGRSK